MVLYMIPKRNKWGTDLSQFEKAWKKFNRKPIPNDITYDELFYIVTKFGFEVDKGDGKHPLKIRYRKLGIKLPIPVHGNHVKEAYIQEVKRAIEQVQETED